MNTVTVNLPHGRTYPVIVGRGVLAQVAQHAAPVNAVITSPPIAALYGAQVVGALKAGGKSAHLLLMPDGEAHKTMPTVQQLLDDMLEKSLGRDGGVVALGGGVVGDVAGFAAAIYMRGVPLVQVPTTLLAQVDAAVGGKTGVNHARGKNLLGAFHQPRAVIADTATLATLPQREYLAGLAEVVKYGLLGDADFFAFVEQHAPALKARDDAALEHIISASVRAKAAIVAADEREQSGRRALLNLGHTFAHAAEAALGYGTWLHGEAVAFGLLAAAKLSERVCGFNAASSERIRHLLHAFELPVNFPIGVSSSDLLAAMGLDKKNSGGEKRFILMRRIGEAYMDSVEDNTVRRVLADLHSG